MKNIDKFMFYITEREAIRKAKERGDEKPWSQYPTFHTTYFCNVRREDDKVTKWIRTHWPTHRNHYLAMCIARLFNKPTTLDAFTYPTKGWTPEYREHVRECIYTIPHPWNGAYIISTNGNKMRKQEYVLSIIDDFHERWRNVEFLHPTCAETHKSFMKVKGLGSFMAAQIVADLKNSEGMVLYESPDWWEFVAPGPGSMRGLSWLCGEDPDWCKPGMFKKLFAQLLVEGQVMARIEEATGLHICNQDLQNNLCEFSKYMRVTYGDGRSKRRYNGKRV